MRTFIDPGNIHRTAWPLHMADNINLYLGSGRAGASFDAWGLMGNGYQCERTSQGVTSFMHADHWHRGAHGIDSRMHAFRIVFADGAPAQAPAAYEQTLHLYDGKLTTSLSLPGLRYTMTAFFNPAQPDILALDIRWNGASVMPDLLLAPEVELPVSYGDVLKGTAELVQSSADTALIKLSIGTAESALALHTLNTAGRISLSDEARGIRLSFSGAHGRHLILAGLSSWKRRDALSTAIAAMTSPEQYAASASAAWHTRFGSAGISVPVPEYQKLWARSLYYTLASYGPDKAAPAQPCGWSGNMWRYSFPQDLSYIQPALLRLGHYDIARSWIEFYHGFIDDMRTYTKRIYNADGAMWAWEFPIASPSHLLDASRPGEPNWYQYEIHNAAYVARMAYETARHLRDRSWTRTVAWPVVNATADFYASAVSRQGKRFGIAMTPSMGQDEMAAHNKKNYLCALFSADYTLRIALAMAKSLSISGDDVKQWGSILRTGLAYESLYDAQEGICSIYEGPLSETLGKQKHPVQLNPLFALPLGNAASFTHTAYQRRYDICRNAKNDFFHGWTLAAFWVSSAHAADAEGLLYDLARTEKSHYVDPDWIQIYETSISADAVPGSTCYYVTSHGLYLQALQDAFVSDFSGNTVIGGACPRTWEGAQFSNLHTMRGETISGEVAGGRVRVTERKR